MSSNHTTDTEDVVFKQAVNQAIKKAVRKEVRKAMNENIEKAVNKAVNGSNEIEKPAEAADKASKKYKGKAVEESKEAKLARKRKLEIQRKTISQLEATLTRMLNWAEDNPEWAGHLLEILTHEIFVSATWAEQAKKNPRDSELDSYDELAESDEDDEHEEESDPDDSENQEDLDFVNDESEEQSDDASSSDNEDRGRSSNQVPRCRCCRAEDNEEALSLEGLTME